MATTTDNFIHTNSLVNSAKSMPEVFEEDGDSRDSGISVDIKPESSSMEASLTKIGLVVESSTVSTTITSRQALVDCTNFAAKTLTNSSSRSSPFYNCDTPPSRKTKPTKKIDPFEDGNFFCYGKHTKKVNSSDSENCEVLNNRKRGSSSTSINSDSKRSRQSMEQSPFDFEDDDDVFGKVETSDKFIATSRLSSSLYNVSTLPKCDRNPSDSSLSDSFGALIGKKAVRAMSVGFMGPDRPLPSILEVSYSLPAVENPQRESQAYRSISVYTLLEEFQKHGETFYSKYIVVDCRFPFEYNGGHVKGAINIHETNMIESVFFKNNGYEGRRIPIFYCEFSQKRGPSMANALRSMDRFLNESSYPNVVYPEMYLLDHGYRRLWNTKECREICEPRNYIPMDTKDYAKELRNHRGARHRSKASSKSQSDLSVGVSGRFGSQRNMRRNPSFASLHSKNSCISLFDSKSDSFEFDSFDSLVPKKSISAYELNSFVSETDVDLHLPQPSVAGVTPALAENQQPVVKLALQVITPDFALPSRNSSMLEESEPKDKLTTVLNFSFVSDCSE